MTKNGYLFAKLLILNFVLVILNGNSAKAQDQEWHMMRYVTDSIPVPTKLVELCKTLEGREVIIAGMDSFSRRDIRLQWESISEDSTYKTSFHEFLMEKAELMCTPHSGGQIVFISDPNKMTFYNPNKFWCTSANEGGSHTYDCNEKYELILPSGWQVCKLLYDKTYRRHGKHKFIPMFIPNDTQSPPRYNGHFLHLTGHGDVGNVSKIEISNIKVLAILAKLGNDFRIACGCEMPYPEIPHRAASKPHVSQPKAQIINKGVGNGAFLQSVFIKNLINTPITVTYRRTDESNGNNSSFTITIPPLGEEFVGYNCHTASGTSLCDIYYRTEILNVNN
jgi:hypothetical protein